MPFDATIRGFLSQGTAASRPAAPNEATDTLSFYFSTDTETLSFYDWNDAAWQDVAASTTFASTTEQLTGTEAAKASTPDSVAALWEKGSDIASAATISVGEGGFFHVTGTTTITDIDFAVDKTGRAIVLVFDDILTLTHNSTTLILPTGANITTAAGDSCLVVSEGSDNIRVVWYQRKDGTSLAGGGGTGALTLISSVVTSSSQADVTFSSISNAYKDLEIIVNARSTDASTQVNLRLQFNGDTGSNYSWSLLAGNGSSAASGSATGLTSIERLIDFPGASATANTPGVGHLLIGDYKGTTFFKEVVAIAASNASTDKSEVGAGLWSSTSAITSIKVFFNAGNFVDGSVVSLYGRGANSTTATAASTTEVLTGTDTDKYVTPNALAAIWEKGADEASGSTVSLGEGGYFHITGTTTITDIDFDTDKSGRSAILEFDGILTLTHNATSLILPTGANITTAAGDTCCVVSEDGSNNVRIVWYQRKDGTALTAGSSGALVLITETVTSSSQADVTFSSISSTYRDLIVTVRGRGTVSAGDTNLLIQLNSDTGSNYYSHTNFFSGTGSVSTESIGGTSWNFGRLLGDTGPTNGASFAEITIFDYKGTTYTKSAGGIGGYVFARSSGGTQAPQFYGDWNDTSAVNTVKVFLASGNFKDNSVVSLYGRM